MAIRLSVGERRFLTDENHFLGQALVELEQRGAYVKRVENVLSTSGMDGLETQLFREQQLTSTITYLEVLSREAAIAIASVGAERLQPKDLKDRSPFEALRKFDITWDMEFPKETCGSGSRITDNYVTSSYTDAT